MWMVRLGLPKTFCVWDSQNNSLFIPSTMLHYTMQKQLPFVYWASKMLHVFLRFSICLLFDSCGGTHVPVFWIFPISRSRSRLETACWLTPNCSASCFCFANHLRPTVLAIPHLRIFLTVFQIPCLPSCLVLKSPPKLSFTRILRCRMFTTSFLK